MRCVTYNIQYSLGKDGRFDLARCIDAVRDADIIALQEVERHWPRTGMVDQPALIGELLPDFYWVYGPSFDVHLESEQTAAGVDNRRRQFGDMLLSRWPILSSRLVVLPKTRYADRFNMRMGALEGVIDSPIGPLRAWSIHLGYLDTEERLAHLKCLLEVQGRGVKEGGAWSGPASIGDHDWSGGDREPALPAATLWLGDFNMEPGSPQYRLVTDGAGGGFVDAWRLAASELGEGITCPDSLYDGVRKPRRIDYCFVSPELAPRVARCWVDAADQGSDHQPVWLELSA